MPCRSSAAHLANSAHQAHWPNKSDKPHEPNEPNAICGLLQDKRPQKATQKAAFRSAKGGLL